MNSIAGPAIVYVLAALLVIGGVVVFTGNVPLLVGGFTPVYCDTFEFRGCGYKPQGIQTSAISRELFQSPQNLVCNFDRCDVEQITQFSQTCGTGLSAQLSCLSLNGNQGVSQLPLRMKRGDSLSVAGGTMTVQWRPWNLELRSCGSAACAFDDAPGGSGISGTFIAANTCTFITDDTIYGPSGQIIREPAGSSISYTIPPGEAYLVKVTGAQTICGQAEDQCSSDADCKAGRPFEYQGKGASVSSGNLYVYICNQYGTQPGESQLDWLPINAKPDFQYGKRCESSFVKSGVCTPGSNSCGSNAVCNVATFACEAAQNVACRSDAECGSGEFYDMSAKAYFKNVCQNAGLPAAACARVQTRSVECAYGSECAPGYFCDAAQGRCLQNTQQKTTCPTACCEGDDRYFDKPAPPGNVCCPGGLKYALTLAQCGDDGGGGGGGNGAESDWLPWLLVGGAAAILAAVIIKKRAG